MYFISLNELFPLIIFKTPHFNRIFKTFNYFQMTNMTIRYVKKFVLAIVS